ncbi:MAG: transcriptional repressor [Defluviitaleaceae bacterium]|nr:transcriptional repressor [Defluviitaleaceae bacterium]
MDRQRDTVQRRIILETMKQNSTHPTVEEVYCAIHKNHPAISKATVYRNLRQLAAGGEIAELFMPDDLERYDNRTDKHYHFKCKICGKISDVDVAYLDGMDEAVRDKYGFRVERHDVVFSGICGECLENIALKEDHKEKL